MYVYKVWEIKKSYGGISWSEEAVECNPFSGEFCYIFQVCSSGGALFSQAANSGGMPISHSNGVTVSDGQIGASHDSNIPVEVRTRTGGRLRGYESIFLHRRVRSFLSVPFAEPPLGDLRFRPPVTKRPWNRKNYFIWLFGAVKFLRCNVFFCVAFLGTLDASRLSPACMQGRDTYNESFWGSEMWNHNTPISEDCLYMNIWAPAEAKWGVSLRKSIKINFCDFDCWLLISILCLLEGDKFFKLKCFSHTLKTNYFSGISRWWYGCLAVASTPALRLLSSTTVRRWR